MRVSTNTIFDKAIGTLQQQLADLIKTQQQVATGRRVMTPSDDPVAAARALDVSQAAAVNTQYSVNRRSAQSTLGLAEGALQSLTTLIQDVRTTALNAGNPTLTNIDREMLATELRSRLDHLVGLSNSTDGAGLYLFSGYKGNTKPFTLTATSAQYDGDQGQRMVQVGPARQIAISDSGADVFERIKNGNGVFVAAADATNTGSGVISPGSVVDPTALTGHQYELNFTVTAAAGATAGAALGAGLTTFTPNAAAVGTIAAGTLSLRFGTGAPVSIGAITLDGANNAANIAAAFDAAYVLAGGTPGTFSAAAGVVTKAADGNTVTFGIAGTAVSAAAAAATRTTLATQTGLSAAQLGTQAYDASTTYDVVDLSTTPASTTLSTGNLYTSGNAISFDGVTFDIQGTPANGDRFTIDPSSNQSMFQTLKELITAVDAPVNDTASSARLSNSLNLALLNLDNALDNVLRARADLGTRLQEIDALDNLGDDMALQYQHTLSQLQDVDYSRAISDLTRQQSYLEAAQKSFLKVTGMSLFDFM